MLQQSRLHELLEWFRLILRRFLGLPRHIDRESVTYYLHQLLSMRLR